MKVTQQSNSLRELWNELTINFDIVICSEELQGCSLVDLNILKLIDKNQHIKIKELVKILKLPNSSLTNAINRLVKKELLQRELNNNDLRSFDLKLTQKGVNAVKAHTFEENKKFEELLSGLNENEQDEFIRLFRKMVNNQL